MTQALSGVRHIDALITGVDELRWNRAEPVGTAAELSFSFFTRAPDYAHADLYGPPPEYDYDPTTFHPFTPEQRAAALSVLQQYAEIANLSFLQRADDADAQIHFAQNEQWGESIAYAYLPYPGYRPSGDVWLSHSWPGNARMHPGQQGYATLLHEIGHALGLKHPFDGEPGGSQVTLHGVEDSEQYTVMSYTLHPHSLFAQMGASGEIRYRDIEASTPMLYDIAAIQFLYGANTATAAGDDVYKFSPSKPFFMCLWDGGGADTLSVSNFTLGCRVDLRAGHFSDITIASVPVSDPGWAQPTYDGTDNLSIAVGVTIENATGGAGDDFLRGNGAGNRLRGGAGDDTLAGAGGADRLSGGGGADTFVFDRPGASSDYVVDFTPADGDTLELKGSGFAGGTAEQMFTDQLLTYDDATGRLYYDADGDGAGKVLVVKLAGCPALDASDITVT